MDRCLYWIGVTMTLICLAFVMAGNTELVGRFEHRASPYRGRWGSALYSALFATEGCYTASSGATGTDRTSPLVSELEAARPEADPHGLRRGGSLCVACDQKKKAQGLQ